MSVWRRYPGHGFPSLVTTNTAQQRPIFRDREAAGELLRVITEVRTEEHVDLHAYVIMPDHLHLVLSVQRKTSLGRVLQLIKGRFAWRYNRSRSRSGKVWQERYHEKALRDEAALLRALEYVEDNPVTGGLAERPEDYEWSSARNRELGQAKSLTPEEAGIPDGRLPA